MKLLIINENPLEKIGQEYYSVFSWIRFPLKLAAHCERVTMWCPVTVAVDGTTPPNDGWCVKLGNLRIEDLDYYESFVQYCRLWPRRVLAWRKQADRLIEEHDAVILRLPSPMVSLVTRCARRKGRPLILIVSGNIETQSDRIVGNRGLKRLFYLTLAKLVVLQDVRCARHAALVYVYSEELKRRFEICNAHVRIMRTPHLSLDDFVQRTDTCQSGEIRLLRVCWLLPSKGLDYLLEAVALMVKKGFRLRLEIVGKEKIPGYRARLEKLAGQLGIRDKVTFSGWVPFDRIKEVYLGNDIQVISSLSEGTPRCIVEGAACGLPLVSTTAGGCGDTLMHEVNALLVPPGDTVRMVAEIERIIKDKQLRLRLINEGYKMADTLTFEKLGTQFLNEIRGVISETKKPILPEGK